MLWWSFLLIIIFIQESFGEAFRVNIIDSLIKYFRIELNRKQHQPEGLVTLVNMLSRTHAQLLDKQSYKLIQLDKDEKTYTPRRIMLQEQELNGDGLTIQFYQEVPQLQISQHIRSTKQWTTNRKARKLTGNNERAGTLLQKQKTKQGYHAAKVPLSNIMNTMFTGIIEIGTPPQNFSVIFDTGSALTFISSVRCHDIGCVKSNQYNEKESSTFSKVGYKVQVEFGSGKLNGIVNKEIIKVDGLELKQAFFIEITKQRGDAFHDGDFDGIVGLGFPHMTGFPTLFDHMMKQHNLRHNIFSVYMNNQVTGTGSQIIFGGVNNNLIKGKWKFHKVTEKFYWSINCQKISVGSHDTGLCSHKNPCKLVLDTGTSLLNGPSDQIGALLSHIEVAENCQNLHELPEIKFLVDKQTYSLTSKEYILTMSRNGIENPYQHSQLDDLVGCAAALYPLDVEKPQGPLWVLGDIFLSKYAVQFDRGSNRVGLALAKF